MSFCLPKEFSSKFKQALVDGKIDPEKLSQMNSAERRAAFGEYVGSEHAPDVNALFESKLLLKDQQRGLVTWAKKVAGITEETRRDLLSRIDRMTTALDADSEQAFLEDLASKKLGTGVSFEEAQHVVKLTQEVNAAKEKIPEGSPLNSTERLNYGLKYVAFQDYVRSLKGDGKATTFKELAQNPSEWAYALTGTAKSLLSSMDNSFFGRQGFKILATNPTLWMRGFMKSFGDMGKELRKVDAITPIKAEIYSRPNALNGIYEKMKLDIGISSEEAFPSALPARVPLLGRLFKASESAFQGGALRLRADYADRLIAQAEKFGVDMQDANQAVSIGRLVNSSTGRGNIGKAEAFGKEINVALFSIKFLKSNIDTLTAHGALKGLAADAYAKVGGGKPTYTRAQLFTRRTAAANLVKIAGTISFALYMSELLNPGSVEWDSRSSKFGKIKIGEGYFDVSGGMASLVTLASRLVPTSHDGEWGFWSKSATTGNWTNLTAGRYGQQTALDMVENFAEGKLSPPLGLLRDVWSGKNFQGNAVTPQSAAYGLATPLPIQSSIQLSKVQPLDTPEGVAGLILDGLGFSSATYAPKN